MNPPLPKIQKNHQNQPAKTLTFPAFFPDATYSTISHVPLYLVEPTLTGVVITTLHAKAHQLDDLLDNLNISFTQFANLPQNLITLSDSGGFQVLSLIHNKKLGKITDDGAIFKYPKDGKKIELTPETSQQIQYRLKTDIRTLLDYPIMGHESKKTIKHSVMITTQWAKRGKKEFLKLHNMKNSYFTKTSPSVKYLPNGKAQITFNRPLLNGVVQGGNDKTARKESAKELTKLGFDIYGFGGWPMTPENKLNTKLLEHFLSIIPSNKVAYAMGLGTPDDIYTLTYMGYHLFDCTIPTRNARHGSLFVTKGQGEPKGKHYDLLHIKTARYEYDTKPIDSTCDCPVCKTYSRAYIRFLFKSKNPVASTLASIHNIWWYNRFVDKLTYTKMVDNNKINKINEHLPARDSVTEPADTLPKIILQVFHDATCKVKNAHIKGHSGKGLSYCGYFIKNQKGEIIAKNTKKLSDEITIPEAEFRCFLIAIKHAYDILQTEYKEQFSAAYIKTNTDSQLLANWINGTYKIKKPHIKALYEKYQKFAKELAKQNIYISVTWHARENKDASLADTLANKGTS